MANDNTLFQFTEELNNIIYNRINQVISNLPIIQYVKSAGELNTETMELPVNTSTGGAFTGIVCFPKGIFTSIAKGDLLLAIPTTFNSLEDFKSNYNVLQGNPTYSTNASSFLIPLTLKILTSSETLLYRGDSKISISDDKIVIQKNSNTQIEITESNILIKNGSSNIAIDNAGKISLNSSLPVSVSLDVKTAGNISLANHTHTSGASGSPTSPPIPTP